ncbi:MAG: ABC transporter permease [Deltaproteobacteria bacterium]|jgi:peptide/nickel transport system permease protein|nr:ABC transporter permease [Deltaproteobacteria bacterium]
MASYALRRLLALLPTLVVISMVVFGVIRLIPGNQAAALLGLEASPEAMAQAAARLGLDKPLISQYWHWTCGLFRGDLGTSIFFRDSVSIVILEHLGPTVSLALLAEIFALFIALPGGVLAAWRRGRTADMALRILSVLGASVPGFLMALFLMLIFAVKLRWLPVAGYRELDQGLLAHLRFLILPALALGLVQAALMLRMTRSSLIGALSQDPIRTARAKGVPERLVLWRHGLRLGALPILTALGQSFGSLITGAVVIETIFNIPGMGQLVTHAIIRRDVVVVQAVLLVLTLICAGLNLAVDLLYGAIDPRVRARQRGEAK